MVLGCVMGAFHMLMSLLLLFYMLLLAGETHHAELARHYGVGCCNAIGPQSLGFTGYYRCFQPWHVYALCVARQRTPEAAPNSSSDCMYTKVARLPLYDGGAHCMQLLPACESHMQSSLTLLASFESL
jgi:hypothetical protein